VNTASPPRVTVLTPVCNGERYLAEALDSALAQRWTDFELVLVNDGSTDATAAIARAYCARDPRIRLVEQANAGLPAARNAAMRAGRGELFALLDCDDVWLPDHLEHAVAAFDAEPDLGLVHSNIECIDAEGALVGIYRRHWKPDTDAYRVLALRHEHICCPSAVFRRHCVQAVGGFDLQFTGLGCEDRDLWLRIAERYRVHYIDHVTARYRVHPGGMSRNRERMLEARRLLLAKLAATPRGAPLARHMEAMIESDLGMEFLEEGHPARALRAQLKALAIRPQTARVWRRLLRPAAATFGAVLFGL
jgi:glycosyltransferase involved in cell wall biosynthesis